MKNESSFLTVIAVIFLLFATTSAIVACIQRDHAEARATDLRNRLDECKDYRHGMRGDGKEGGLGGLPMIIYPSGNITSGSAQ